MYKHYSRPTREYARNVERSINDEAYRKNNPDGFRRIHRELHKAVQRNIPITLTILETHEDYEQRKAAERRFIKERGTLNGTS